MDPNDQRNVLNKQKNEKIYQLSLEEFYKNMAFQKQQIQSLKYHHVTGGSYIIKNAWAYSTNRFSQRVKRYQYVYYQLTLRLVALYMLYLIFYTHMLESNHISSNKLTSYVTVLADRMKHNNK